MHNIDRGNSFFALVALSVILLAGLGCNLADRLKASDNSGSTSPERPTTDRPTASKADSKTPIFGDAGTLADFVAQLKETVGAEDPNVLKLLVYESHVSIQVQDPNKPENVDSYTYRNGSLGSATPVKLIGGGKLEENVFRLSEVNIAALPTLTEEVMGKLSDIEGGSMVGYSIGRGLPFDKNIGISPLVNSSRKSISAKADKNGKLTKWEVS